MPGRRIALAVVLLASAAVVGGCGGKKEPPKDLPPPQVTVIRPAVVEVSDYWTYNGHLETTKSIEVRSKIRGYLSKTPRPLFVEGTEVTEGTTLYLIDKMEYETAKEKAEADVAKAEADIGKAEADVGKAEAVVKTWVAQVGQAQTELARVKKALAAGGGESETNLVAAQATHDVRVAELDAARANVKSAEANVTSAKAAKLSAEKSLKSAGIQLGYTDVKAKISGLIGKTEKYEGDLILADTTVLTTIKKVDELYVYFDAPEADFLEYQRSPSAVRPAGLEGPHIPVEIGVTGEEGLKDGFPHTGRIDFQDNRVETATGTIRIRGWLKNPLRSNGTREMYPGLYARVRVPKGTKAPLPVIPEDCLMSGQEGRYVYVVAADNTVQKRPVTVGATVWKAPAPVPGATPPGWAAVNPSPKPPAEGQPPAPSRRTIKSVVAITKGLDAGDRVILDGLQKAQPTKPVTPDEWTLTPPPAAPAPKG